MVERESRPPTCPDCGVMAIEGPYEEAPEDFRNTLRWRLEAQASRYGRSIPPDELESMVAEVERRALRDAWQTKLDADHPLRHQLRTVGRRQRALGLIGRHDYCPCGSGKKFKRCCSKKS